MALRWWKVWSDTLASVGSVSASTVISKVSVAVSSSPSVTVYV